ncbi:MAG: Holliday junction resolvase RuvX [Fidelibacterota bacterium]
MGRVLGVDYGDRRIGLALSDPLHWFASPFRTLRNEGAEKVVNMLKTIIEEQDVEQVVVGIPKGMQDQETPQTRKVLAFVTYLKQQGIPVLLEDERLSSVSARRVLQEKKIKTGHAKGLVDRTAAAIVLQQYLDRTR